MCPPPVSQDNGGSVGRTRPIAMWPSIRCTMGGDYGAIMLSFHLMLSYYACQPPVVTVPTTWEPSCGHYAHHMPTTLWPRCPPHASHLVTIVPTTCQPPTHPVSLCPPHMPTMVHLMDGCLALGLVLSTEPEAPLFWLTGAGGGHNGHMVAGMWLAQWPHGS